MTFSDLSAELSQILERPVCFKLRTTPSGHLALIDVAMIFTGLDNNHAAEAVRNVVRCYPEFNDAIVKFKFPGRGRQTISVAPLAAAIEFAFLLPGRSAAQARRKAASLLVRHLGGDQTLIDEIYRNRRFKEATERDDAPVLYIPTDHEQHKIAIPSQAPPQGFPAPQGPPVFVPRKPLVIRDGQSVGLPGSDHLYAALRLGENVIKVGVSKDVLERMKALSKTFEGQYELVAIWPNEAVLEELVLDLLKPAKAQIGSSREHFNAEISLDHICQVVAAARNLYRMRMELETSSCKRKFEEMALQDELESRALRRRREELKNQAEVLLMELVSKGDEDAKRTFLLRFQRPPREADDTGGLG
jgi:hypothetical protein